ncbi:cytochrome b/b6 domain-containing protein [Hymenobacter nivis]|uniref:Cytochrome b/b6 domain-containing protein n=1 Tax=Hymenobacter nivis TaxID=1850093 RepID=A0A502HGQ6_9BACT|nr:cytochrome b/b6 domain-containing protein [Hymenobacter nivis]TPG72438.1 cytochrome b/b6 domain-containing protein [Hymenobacter nivis]
MPPVPSPVAAPAAPTHDYSAPLRVWHWGNALLVSGQLLTILFLKVIVDARSAIPEFIKAASKDGGAPTEQQGRAFAHIISDRIWDWHIAIGLGLAAFWLLRVLLELRGPAEVRFSTRLLLVARKYRLAPAATKGDARHELLAKASYALFYVFLTVMVITGLILTWADDVAFLHSIEHTAKEVHNVTMYLIIGFFVVHVVGVVWSEITSDHGLISRMVGGKAGNEHA